MTKKLKCTQSNRPNSWRGNAGCGPRGGLLRYHGQPGPGQARPLRSTRSPRDLGPRRAAAGASPGSGRPRDRVLRQDRWKPHGRPPSHPGITETVHRGGSAEVRKAARPSHNAFLSLGEPTVRRPRGERAVPSAAALGRRRRVAGGRSAQ